MSGFEKNDFVFLFCFRHGVVVVVGVVVVGCAGSVGRMEGDGWLRSFWNDGATDRYYS